MEIKKKVIFFVVSLFLINLVCALTPPDIPDHFKGNLIIDENNASINTEIKIYVNNKLEDKILTKEAGKYDLYVKTGNKGDEVKLKVNNILALTTERRRGETFILDLKVWTDRDEDGVNDDVDKLIGNSDNVSSNFNNLTVFIDDSSNIEGSFSGNKNIIFKDNNLKILEFNFDFDNNILNLYDLKVKKQDNDEGSILVRGMPSKVIKSVYIDKLKSNSNSVCIKDDEISNINEISINCSNGIKMNCPGNNGDYNCYVEENRFKISGLKHSGVKEFYIALPASPPSGGSGGSSGGGGGGGSSITCVEDWQCQSWSVCKPDGTKTCFVLIDKNNCGTMLNKPIGIEECEYIEEDIQNIEQKGDEKGGDMAGITGAVIGTTGKTNWIWLIVVAVIIFALFLLLKFWKGKK